MFFVRRWTGVSPLGVSGIFFSKFCESQHARTCLAGILKTHQLLEYALVQPPLLRPAVPELLVVVLQTLPVGSELGEAVLVDVFDTAMLVSLALPLCIMKDMRTR